LNKIIIASVSSNGVIGNEGKIPWKSKSELSHFRSATIDHPVIMGRRTFESIGKILDRRINIVLSRDKNSPLGKIPGLFHFTSLDQAFDYSRNQNFNRVFIIGGAEIFEQTINIADELLISRMKMSADGETRFPDIDKKIWQLESSRNYDDFELQKYVKEL
jgi:dihydrofolate reductase